MYISLCCLRLVGGEFNDRRPPEAGHVILEGAALFSGFRSTWYVSKVSCEYHLAVRLFFSSKFTTKERKINVGDSDEMKAQLSILFPKAHVSRVRQGRRRALKRLAHVEPSISLSDNPSSFYAPGSPSHHLLHVIIPVVSDIVREANVVQDPSTVSICLSYMNIHEFGNLRRGMRNLRVFQIAIRRIAGVM